jgi:hypothetical protein
MTACNPLLCVPAVSIIVTLGSYRILLFKPQYCLAMQNLKHKILLVLVALTILAEVASIILWTANRPLAGQPSARFSLAVDYTIAVANAAVFMALNAVAFALIFRGKKIGPIFLIAISILNRFISHPIFIGGAHGIFISWTVLLVVFAYLDYRRLSKQT